MKLKLLLFVICLVVIPSLSFSANISPTCTTTYTTKYCEWSLANDDTAINIGFCDGSKTLDLIAAGGTVDQSVALKEDGSATAVATYTLSSAGTYKKEATHAMASLMVDGTLTQGTLTAKLRCTMR